MKILAVISGEYGTRHVENIQKNGPSNWEIRIWKAPTNYPLVIDYPEDYIPDDLPKTDLILSFGEHKGIAELLPEIAHSTRAKAVIAAIDNEAWLPRGLARQLRNWLANMNVACATPKPLCSLTETDYGVTRRERIEYENAYIREFANFFGQPNLELTISPDTKKITKIAVRRDAVCGCARYVADNLIGTSVVDAEEKAGLLHHHFPCLASMGKDLDFGDTLMHVSGNVLKDDIGEQVNPHKHTQYIAPGTRSESE